ncbi:MAG: 50S ribosomal protein L6 [Proteobacteria bacterium]|nr:50S ribosomal protein L6 [Pseudomonadota bacterium]MBU1138704.1 50S ribosomal protein L6 [Pseudomonadota bacterium]MBU1232317.1 50S ribosomal protein L6 [Pseudomonadota bacterium]MBU1419379.1 50S ribosomal protein L6 [Pseudomonadota bacterium]MBU1454219.1 50S ribosomal protein L6 [Pseudomonadota bacterium]
MSRIGKEPIPLPSGVKVDIKGQKILVSGSRGNLEREIMSELEVSMKDQTVLVENRDNSKRTNAFRGLTRSLINNMVIGVDQGFKKILIIEGVGYKANMSENTLTLNVGYSNPVEFSLPEGVQINVEGNNKIVVESIDKELLGLTAAKIRQIRKPEPYKGKGIRYENEYIVRKVGKAGAK